MRQDYVTKLKEKAAAILEQAPAAAALFGQSSDDIAWRVVPLMVTRRVEPAAFVEGIEVGFTVIAYLAPTLMSAYSDESGRTFRRIRPPQVGGRASGRRKGSLSFGSIAVTVLNGVLRPVLAHWHPLLLDYESQRPPEISQLEHEQAWEQNGKLREVLDEVRIALVAYADLLARVAEVPQLTATP